MVGSCGEAPYRPEETGADLVGDNERASICSDGNGFDRLCGLRLQLFSKSSCANVPDENPSFLIRRIDEFAVGMDHCTVHRTAVVERPVRFRRPRIPSLYRTII